MPKILKPSLRKQIHSCIQLCNLKKDSIFQYKKQQKPLSFPFRVFLGHAWRHPQTESFPSSLWTSFPGPQHAQEIGSVIVYVCGENATAVFLAVVSWPVSHSAATRKSAQRRFSVGSDSRPQTRLSFGLVLLELIWAESPAGLNRLGKNTNTLLPNLEQIGFSYLFGLTVSQVARPRVPSGLMERSDLQKQGLTRVRGFAEAKCQKRLNMRRKCFC